MRYSITNVIRDRLRKNILKLSLVIAIFLNLDRIILGTYAIIKVHDVFDSGYPLAFTAAQNILRYGFVTQFPQMLCGVSSFTFPIAFFYVILNTILPLHISYLYYAITAIFIAFSGMFLLLHDEFKLTEAASLIGALFFSAGSIFLPYSITVVGIPLLFWALERIFDTAYAFKQKLLIYLYIIFYFVASVFVIIGPFLVTFYCSYFIFFSTIKKTAKNLITLCSIWGLYFLINVPYLSEIFFLSPDSHRTSMFAAGVSSWYNAARYFIYIIFSIDMQGSQFGTFISIPSLLGLLVIIYYVISSKKGERNKYFYFPLAWIAFIEIISFFVLRTPLWEITKKNMGFLNSFQFDRFYHLLVILFAIVIGMACNAMIRRNDLSQKKNWFLSWVILFCYIFVLLIRYAEFVSPVQFVIQSLSLFVFLIFAMLKIAGKKNFSVSSILLISFSIFLLLNVAHSRISSGTERYNHFFNIKQIKKVKDLERMSFDRFRVVKMGGYHPSQLLYNGFLCADGYVTLYPQSYKEFWAQVIAPELSASQQYRDYFFGFGSRAYLFDSINKNNSIDTLPFNLDLLRLINVKYLFSDKAITDYEKYGLTEVAKRDPPPARLSFWARYFGKGQLYVYQNNSFAPRLFLTDSVEIFDSKERLLIVLGSKTFNYLKNHTLTIKDFVKGESFENLNATNAKIKEYMLTPDTIEVVLSNRYPVVLNWTRNYNTNWRCMADGRELPIFKIYNSFMGVVVPARSHLITFRYKNVNLIYSYVLCAAGFLVINIFVLKHLRNISNE